MSSLSARLLISVTLLLVLFFGATIVVLDSAFREAGEQAQEDILDGMLMALIAEAEPNAMGELEMPPELREPRFANLGSGLYGALYDNTGTPVWTSRSSLGLNVPYGPPPKPGANRFSRLRLEDGTPLMSLSLSVQWELNNGELKPYTFNVAQSLDSFNAQVARFRKQLFTWFGAVAIIMLTSISFVMRGLLRPLRQIESEIREVEEGRRQTLSARYPTELTAVARNMNVLIGSERARAERYRNTLDNLAHSLKTPLAAIRAVLSERQADELTERVESQIERMDDIVRYQLRKPATIHTETVGVASFPVARELSRLVEGLSKVYKDKNPRIELDITEGMRFHGETGDFLEVSGNLLDNACKWCREQVRLTVRPIAKGKSKSGGMTMTVEDDGPGIPAEAADALMQRGTRLDETAPGHGIGLAVVKDIAASYGGDVTIAKSDLGGARITVTLTPP